MSQVVTQVATIANGETVGVATPDLSDFSVIGLVMPAAFTGAALTFQVSVDGSTFVPLEASDGNAVSLAVAASVAIYLDPVILRPWRYLKLVSGSAEAADRAITLVLDRVA